MLSDDAFAHKPTLEGNRVRLMPLAPRHAEAMHALVSDPEVRWFTGTTRTFPLEQVRRLSAHWQETDGRLLWAVEDRETGETLGELALEQADFDNEALSYRVSLFPRFCGRGLGTEAAQLAFTYAFEKVRVHRIYLEVYSFNERARRSYEKLGFVSEGTTRDSLLYDGKRYGATIMSLLAPEWRSARSTAPAVS
jgi:RimJ/RimL family protein N-acetyltransferase